jgi:hypothetical protein
MSINNVEMQDSSGNVYYPHTDASVVKYGASDVGSTLSDVAHKDGTLQTNLNADKVDGKDVGTTAGTISYYDATGNIPINCLVTKGSHIPNLLFNSNFKYGTIGWSGIGSNGFGLVYGANGETEYIVNNTSNSGVSIQTVPHIPMSGGLPVTLSAEMFSIATSGSFYVQIRFWNSSNVQVGGFNVNATLNTGWTKYSGTGNTPTGTAYADIRIIQDGAVVVNTNTAWRKIKVEYSPFATAYSDDSTLDLVNYNSYQPFVQLMGSVTGLKIQTGVANITVSSAGAPASASIIFPTAFASISQVFAVLYNETSATATYINVNAINWTANGFTLVANSGVAQTLNIAWLAIGN